MQKVDLELFLEVFHSFGIQLKGLGKIIGVDGGFGREKSVGEIRNPGILAVEGDHCNGVSFGQITHVVKQTHRDYENIPFHQSFAEMLVFRVRGYEPDFHGTF